MKAPRIQNSRTRNPHKDCENGILQGWYKNRKTMGLNFKLM